MSTEQRIAAESSSPAGEFMLFGVRLVVDSMRKSVSLNNLSQYEHRLDSSSSNQKVVDVAAGYASADEAIPNSSSIAGSSGGRERKRGTPWTEEEHKLFLIGLQKVGKGDWRRIARNFVKSRTPTQVASHAQKYFLRRSNLNRRRRRSSLFDITTDTVATDQIHDQQTIVDDNNGAISQSPPPPAAQSPEASRFPTAAPIYPMTMTMNNRGIGYEMIKLVHPMPKSSKLMADFDLNKKSLNEASPLSLNLSLSLSSSDLVNSASSVSTKHSGFQVMQGFRNGDGMISVV